MQLFSVPLFLCSSVALCEIKSFCGFGGDWSRRITDEQRIIYEVNPAGVVFSVARGHYNQR
jgi:hypothetical protein